MPGLIQIASDGDDPELPKQIKNLVINFINKKNCLILAITPANIELENSVALEIAKKFDPKGERTIGVITKLDLKENGKSMRSIFENELFRLQRNFVGVICRSDDTKTFADALEDEKKLFDRDSYFQSIKDRMGMKYLQKLLNEELLTHIRKTLPKLKQEIFQEKNYLEKYIADHEKLYPNDVDKMKLEMVE